MAKFVKHGCFYKTAVAEPMLEIVESYVSGGKNHDVLLLEDYQPLLPGRQPLVCKKGFFDSYG